MSINVLFFASLRDQGGIDRTDISANDGMTALNVWQMTTNESTLRPNILIARNQEYCDADTLVADGDEIAFFPPVTGG